MAIIPIHVEGKVHYDTEKDIWVQSWIDTEEEIIWITEYKGSDTNAPPLSESLYEFTYRDWNDLDHNRFHAVSRRYIEDPEGSIEDELYHTTNPDPRGIDVKYASIITGCDVAFFWDERTNIEDIYPDSLFR